jgi:glycosyltransferase involved in cell wall biosynthesis
MILFLYSELAEYFLACVRKMLQLYEVDIHIVRWELNKQAPFKFNIPDEIQLYSKNDFDAKGLQTLVDKMNPDLVFCCGWMDNDYVEICKQLRKKRIPVVAGMDNHWQGTLKQYLAQLVSRFTIKKYFSHIWVAGDPQKRYAQKLGFKDDQILMGCYSADVDFFHNLYRQKNGNNSEGHHRFIYVGRYLERKGLSDLWQAFIEFQDERETDWELWCLGTGPLESQAKEHEKIKHFGFVQPDQLPEFINKTDVFILPSHHEPWGVVVHEFAAAGFPLICSDKVGAASAFLEDSTNGFIFESGNSNALKNAMHNIADLSESQLQTMGEISVRKSKKITPAAWSKTFMSVLE